MTKRCWILAMCLFASVALFAGCGHDAGEVHEKAAAALHDTESDTEAEADAAVEVTPELEAILASADGVDGEQDHVVANCPGCGLAMEGSADHAVHVGDYALHFCSDSCSDNFTGDLESSLVALNLPARDEAPQPIAEPEAEPEQ